MRCRPAVTSLAIAFVPSAFLFFSAPGWLGDSLWILLSQPLRRLFGGPAPYICSTLEHHRIPDTYRIELVNGYSLEHHKQGVGRADDLERAILHVGKIDDPFISRSVVYKAKLNDSTLLTTVRLDAGVLYIKCAANITLR